MVICIECQVVDDEDNVKIDKSDGWSARTIHGEIQLCLNIWLLLRKIPQQYLQTL